MTYRAKQFISPLGSCGPLAFLWKGYVKPGAQGKFHLSPDGSTCTIIPAFGRARIPVNSGKFPKIVEVKHGGLHGRACASRHQGAAAAS
jgi:hypothetical protein